MYTKHFFSMKTEIINNKLLEIYLKKSMIIKLYILIPEQRPVVDSHWYPGGQSS